GPLRTALVIAKLHAVPQMERSFFFPDHGEIQSAPAPAQAYGWPTAPVQACGWATVSSQMYEGPDVAAADADEGYFDAGMITLGSVEFAFAWRQSNIRAWFDLAQIAPRPEIGLRDNYEAAEHQRKRCDEFEATRDRDRHIAVRAVVESTQRLFEVAP